MKIYVNMTWVKDDSPEEGKTVATWNGASMDIGEVNEVLFFFYGTGGELGKMFFYLQTLMQQTNIKTEWRAKKIATGENTNQTRGYVTET